MPSDYVETWKSHIKRMMGDASDLSYLLSKMWWESELNEHTKREVEAKIEKIVSSFKEVK